MALLGGVVISTDTTISPYGSKPRAVIGGEKARLDLAASPLMRICPVASALLACWRPLGRRPWVRGSGKGALLPERPSRRDLFRSGSAHLG